MQAKASGVRLPTLTHWLPQLIYGGFSMVNPFCQTARSDAWQQALAKFGISGLTEKLSSFSDPDFDAHWMNLEQQELESLAIILIRQLSNNLNGKLIASCLNSSRHGECDVQTQFINVEIAPQSVDLPINFPDVQVPDFLYGDQLQWISDLGDTDWGVVIGRFYSFAPHRCCWMWGYLIWLNKNSPSATRKDSDTAWEDDLELLVMEDNLNSLT